MTIHLLHGAGPASARPLIRLGLAAAICIATAVGLHLMFPSLGAARDLSRGWLYLRVSQSECMRRARATAMSEHLPLEKTTGQDIFWSKDNVLGATHCLHIDGNKTIAFIIVYSDSDTLATAVRDQLYEGIKSGGPYE